MEDLFTKIYRTVPIQDFLGTKGMLTKYSIIKKNGSVIYIFTHEIILLMNKLNLKLQGKEELICVLARQVHKFMLKWKVFIIQINNNVILTQELLNLSNLDSNTFENCMLFLQGQNNSCSIDELVLLKLI